MPYSVRMATAIIGTALVMIFISGCPQHLQRLRRVLGRAVLDHRHHRDVDGGLGLLRRDRLAGSDQGITFPAQRVQDRAVRAVVAVA